MRAARSIGLTRNTGPNEIARAALESVCFQTRDLLDAMRQDWSAAADTVLRVDGGMVASDWTMQRLADILNSPSTGRSFSRRRRSVRLGWPAAAPGSGPTARGLPTVGEPITGSSRRWPTASASGLSPAGGAPYNGRSGRVSRPC